MALELPGWAVKGLHFLGYEFPQTNEDVLDEWATHLGTMSAEFASSSSSLEGALKHLKEHNKGPGMESFESMFHDGDSDKEALNRFKTGTDIAAKGCSICSTAVVIMKGIVIAQAIAAVPAALGGPFTFGLKKACEYAIDRAVDACINKVLGE